MAINGSIVKNQKAAVAATVAANLLPPQLGRTNYTTAARFANQAQSNRYEGFSGDGDYVELPILTGDSVEYFNNADVSQFTVAKADINAAVDDWVGFTFDETDGLIYIVAVDEGTTPNTYYSASVNSAGTVVNIGNAQPSVDFTTTATAWWHTNANSAGGSAMQRAADGSGNLFVRQTNTGGMEEMEINITTGAIASDPAVVDANIIDVAWKSAVGNYYSFDAITLQIFYNANTKVIPVQIANPENFGWPLSTIEKRIQWKGRVIHTIPTSAGLLANRLTISITAFDAWLDSVISSYGMA